MQNLQSASKIKLNLLRKKIFTFDQLISILKCSVRSGRNKLKEWQAYSSYNKNGSYYTLPSVPHFDKNGLWQHKDAYFSQNRSVKNTIVFIVNRSSSGLSGSQVGDILKLSPRSFLHHFRSTPGIQREKHGGVYIYFSDKHDVYKRQLRNSLNSIKSTVKPMSDIDVVLLLVSFIKHNNISLNSVMDLPEVKEKKLSADSIRNFFDQHDLQKKNSGYNALKMLKMYIQKISSDISAKSLFQDIPVC